MNILNKGKKSIHRLIISVFIIVVILLVLLLVIIKPKKIEPSNNELDSLEKANIELSFLEDQDELASLFERETFLSNNLSSLSPEKEVLGGTFYLTNVYWSDKDSAIIEYEDGHIALRAKVIFAEGLSVDSFEIIPEEIVEDIND